MYLAFAWQSEAQVLIVVFLVYGACQGLTEPAEKAWVVDLAPPALRGTALGAYHGSVGLAALPASVLFGFLWQQLGAPVAFLSGAALALGAALWIRRVPEPQADQG